MNVQLPQPKYVQLVQTVQTANYKLQAASCQNHPGVTRALKLEDFIFFCSKNSADQNPKP